MAREDASILGVIGAGFQAETQVEAVVAVRPIQSIRVWSRDQQRQEKFANNCSARLGVNAQPSGSAQEAVTGADIVVTVTSSREPVLKAEWISPGTHINAAGSNQIGKRELPGDLVYVNADRVAVDSLEQSLMESGDLMIPLNENPEYRYKAVELSEIVTGRSPGRERSSDITIFKSNGLALEDIAVAGYVYDRLNGCKVT
jgi:ornithine cyclodeaminase/alanine dehydrogenase-like protein (mu-crystallin family)